MTVPVSNSESLHGKVAVITGGAGGIGRKTAEVLSARGATVYVLDLAGAITSSSSATASIAVDVSDTASLQAAVEQVLTETGRIDIAIACAGTVSGAGLQDENPDETALVLNVNLLGFINLLRVVIPTMQQQRSGKIVALGSVASRVGGVKSGPVYIGAKAGVSGVVKWAAKNYGPDGIHVNAVSPGPVLTDMWQGLNGGDLVVDATGYPLGRLGYAEDIAQPIAFLAGPESNWITGQTLEVNGGSYFA